jgi:hypothetical protein
MRGHPTIDRRARLVRVRDRSRQLAARSRDPCRSQGAAPAPDVRERPPPAWLEIRVAHWQDVIRIELSGDLSLANVNRLSGCLEDALETRADRVILDLRGLDRLDPEAVSPILVAQFTADSEHRELLLIPGSDSVQRVLDRVQGPFSYLGSDDELRLPSERGRPRRRILDVLLGSTDRLIAATENAPEPVRTLEYVGASVLLGALELWLSIEDRRP